ncbi:MAG: DUF4105 domain-containing protein [Labilithrix sp.]|nr:DUF4105 domain-containing protein [Labilithrix sp.]MCW5815323.1 DUF4105 domain-containing protein [Labilithrix sp.]
MRLLFAVLFSLAALVFVREARADEPEPPPTVYLYTIGPHSDFPSRLGHALLCAREAGHDEPAHGRCFDYGVADSEDMFEVGWTAMRGRPNFVPVVIGESVMLEFFKERGRAIERQSLPLSGQEAASLVGAMEREVSSGKPFAYHPYWANCTTKLRDHIDVATNGKLRPGPSTIPPGTLRDYFEEGHSGRIAILTAMAIYFGEGNDHRPTPWEAMLVPAILRDGVAERFGVPPEQVAERLEPVLPTSRALGRIVVFVVAFALFLTVRFCARRDRLGLALKIVGGTLGTLAVTVEMTSALVKWPEISHNWALLLLWPIDLALPYLGKRLALYLKIRIAVTVVVAVLEIVSVAHQPLLQLVALVVLPFAALLSALKSAKPVTETEPAPAV